MNPQKSAPKKAEHILQKGEDFSAADWISVLNSIIRDSPFPMWIADKTGTVIQTNKALCAVLQLENEQISGKYNVLEDENLIKQGVMPQVKAVFKVHKIARFTIFWSGAALKKDAFAKAPDLWIDVTIFPILNKKGQLSHVACHWVDISERVEAERQLRLSEESNRAIIDNAGLGIGYYDLDGVILRMNQKACSFMGMAEDELLGRGTLDVYGPEMGALILKRINKAAASTTSETYDDNVPLPTGTRWFRSTYAPTIDTDGNATAVQIISEDITPLKDVEMAFRENRRALETLVGNLPGMAYRCDNDENWTMRYLSEGCFDLTGYQPQDLIQNKIISYNALIHEQDRPYVHQVVQAALNKHQPFELTYRIITAASEEKWV